LRGQEGFPRDNVTAAESVLWHYVRLLRSTKIPTDKRHLPLAPFDERRVDRDGCIVE
jgi:hypothetical protein